MTFSDCVLYCATNRELVQEFDRLSGTHLSEIGNRSPIHTMIDEATGRDNDAMRRFVAFVFTCIWLPMLEEYRRTPAP